MKYGFNPHNIQLKINNKKNDVLKNIGKSYLHNVVARNRMFPCANMIQWIVGHANVDTKNVTNDQVTFIENFMLSDLEVCGKFPLPKLYLTNQWVGEFSYKKYCHKIISE
jgi:hypothetical protein